jgi:hypothetical protein
MVAPCLRWQIILDINDVIEFPRQLNDVCFALTTLPNLKINGSADRTLYCRIVKAILIISLQSIRPEGSTALLLKESCPSTFVKIEVGIFTAIASLL